jgi:hypothetical protein
VPEGPAFANESPIIFLLATMGNAEIIESLRRTASTQKPDWDAEYHVNPKVYITFLMP